MGFEVTIYILAFLFGIVIGSFLNVCIYRIPLGESLSARRSHCMSCGYQLRWFDLIPLFSWLFLRGHCRRCHSKISAQYPIVEAANGVLYVTVFLCCGISIESVLYCLMTSALLALSVIDFRTYVIPIGFNIFILTLGILRLIYKFFLLEERSFTKDYLPFLIGLVLVSGILGLIWFLSKGKAMGGGDVKLMGAAGLLLGWKHILLAFVVGCILGAVIHSIRMKVSKEGHMLAMGPYLSAGIMIAVLAGNPIIEWYGKLIGF